MRIPDDAPAGSYVSLRVVGESMDPLLHTGDSVLVQVGTAVVRDTVVLARVPDAGYVVKRVARVTRAELELQSLNDAFPPIVVPRDESHRRGNRRAAVVPALTPPGDDDSRERRLGSAQRAQLDTSDVTRRCSCSGIAMRRRTRTTAERSTMREHERGHDEGTTRDGGVSSRRGRAMRRLDTARGEYAAAFERVRLVRAWIAAAAALVAVLSGYVAVIERVMK